MDALDAAPLCPSPRELRLERVTATTGEIVVMTAARRHTVACPECGHPTRRVHSRYRRALADLPWHGLRVRVALSVRKFFCDVPACRRRIFTERLPVTAAPYARRTARAADALRAIGLALGGAGGARLASALGLPVSATTVLHRVRTAPLPDVGAPRAVGIDEWAWRKGRTYGTIIVDLEARRVLDLLPDRAPDTVAAWFRAHPGIDVISRDRAEGYADGARRGAPGALQVADRFHLVKNLGDAVHRVLCHHAGLLRDVAHDVASGPAPWPRDPRDPRDLPPANETAAALSRARTPRVSADLRASAESRSRRLDRYGQVMALRGSGSTIQEIATALGLSIGTVHGWLHSDGFPERARHRRGTDPVVDAIRARWAAGCQSAAAVWRALRTEGFTGSRRMVQREVARLGLRHDGHGGDTDPECARVRVRPPSPRHIAWLFGRGDAAGTEEDRRFRHALCAQSPELATVRDLAQHFVHMVRTRASATYDAWLRAAATSELRGFARGLRSDDAAVRAALSTPWSNGPTEGHIHRLKLLKRTMYGRANLDLLRSRLLARG